MFNKRRKSREICLQILFQKEFSPELSITDILGLYKKLKTFGGEILDYAEELIVGITDKRQDIDTIITTSSVNWKIARMSIVDRNIMRIAVFELKFALHQLPPAVVINEAIEIAKKYGSVESPVFINGVLQQTLQN